MRQVDRNAGTLCLQEELDVRQRANIAELDIAPEIKKRIIRAVGLDMHILSIGGEAKTDVPPGQVF